MDTKTDAKFHVVRCDGRGRRLYFAGTIGGSTANWHPNQKRAVTFTAEQADKTRKAFDGDGIVVAPAMTPSRRAMIEYLKLKVEELGRAAEDDYRTLRDGLVANLSEQIKSHLAQPAHHLTCANGHAEVAFAFDPKHKPGQELCPVCRGRKLVDELRTESDAFQAQVKLWSTEAGSRGRIIAIRDEEIASLKARLTAERVAHQEQMAHLSRPRVASLADLVRDARAEVEASNACAAGHHVGVLCPRCYGSSSDATGEP